MEQTSKFGEIPLSSVVFTNLWMHAHTHGRTNGHPKT